MENIERLYDVSKLLRYYILTSTTAAGSGHPTSCLSSVELMAVLFFGGYFKTDLENHDYVNNDRLIFSKGHGAPLLYSMYAVAGKLSEDDLMTLRHIDSRLEGHPSMRFEYSECASGSLGMGFGIGAGIALEAKRKNVSHNTYVLMGDSEIAEGSVFEAASIASFYKLDNLIGIVDVNRLGQRGETMHGWDLHTIEKKFEAFGCEVFTTSDGHDIRSLIGVYEKVKASKTNKPKIILARTVKGKGVRVFENAEGWHGRTLSWEQLDYALSDLGVINKEISIKPEMPEIVSEDKNNSAITISTKYDYETGVQYGTRDGYAGFIKNNLQDNKNLVVLDAEVSNSTLASVAKGFENSFYEMFIAEGNMISVATGMSNRGVVPLVSTFAAFYARAFDQIRMSQYTKSNIKFISSHSGLSSGADGASNMGLEDIASFRSIRDCVVFEPADAISAEKLIGAAVVHQGNVYVRTTKIPVDLIYKSSDEFVVGGSKVLRSSGDDIVTVVASGITVHEALLAYDMLKSENINIRVIDCYSIKPLDKKTLNQACFDTKALVTVECHYSEGGLYEAVSGVVNKTATPVFGLAVQKIPHSGKINELMEAAKVDAKAIVEKVKKIIDIIN